MKEKQKVNNTNINTTINTNSLSYNERIKFYADTPQQQNKYFCYKITSILTLKEALWRFFDKGWNIRSVWYEKIDLSTGEVVDNLKIPLQEYLNEYIQEKISKLKRK
jgi:hypothetical protein